MQSHESPLANRNQIVAYLLLLFVIALISIYFAITSIVNTERFERANFTARIRALMEAARLEIQVDISKAYEATSYLKDSTAVKGWFLGEENRLYRKIAQDELTKLMIEREFDQAFAARVDTGQFFIGSQEIDILSRDDSDDSWFFDALTMDNPITINVDYNRELDRTMLWVNAQVTDKGKVIGITGIGLDLDDILIRLKNLTPGEGGMILIADELGRIQLAYPTAMYNKNLGFVLNNPGMINMNEENSNNADFSKSDYIYLVSPIRNTDLMMIVMARVSDFLAPVLGRNRILSLLSIFLIIVLIPLFLLIILRLRKIIIQQSKSQEVTIYSMSMLAELKDQETGAHILRTKKYCRILAEELSRLPKYKNYLTSSYIDDLERSAPLHDIGKVGIPDSILLKPGKLNHEEFEVIKTHTTMGAEVLENAMKQLNYEAYFKIGIQLVRYHHEKWDGSGYPEGLEGEEIPLSARIMAIADVYDALRSSRPYKEAFSHERAVDIITQGAGNHFEPELIRLFLKHSEDFRSISLQYAD